MTRNYLILVAALVALVAFLIAPSLFVILVLANTIGGLS